MNKIILITTISVFCFSANLEGQQLKLLLGGGLELGGDEVYELFFTNGDSSKGRAGQGGFIEAGGLYQLKSVPDLHFRGTMGFKFLLNPTENANTRITRFPVNISANWMIDDNFRLGVGASKHLSAKVIGDGFVQDRDFSSSIGPRLEFAYKGIALTYSHLNYTDQNNMDFDASSFGLAYSGTINFRKKTEAVPKDQ